MNKKDLRVVKTLRHIDGALIRVLEENRFREISVTALCELAAVNKSTFYKYYQGKEDCLNQFLDRLLSEYRTEVQTGFLWAPLAQIDEQSYQDAFLRLARRLAERREAYLAAWNHQHERNFYQEILQVQYEAIRQSMESDRMDASYAEAYRELFAHLFAEQAVTTLRWWLEHHASVSEEEMIWVISRNMRYGFFATYRRLQRESGEHPVPRTGN